MPSIVRLPSTMIHLILLETKLFFIEKWHDSSISTRLWQADGIASNSNNSPDRSWQKLARSTSIVAKIKGSISRTTKSCSSNQIVYCKLQYYEIKNRDARFTSEIQNELRTKYLDAKTETSNTVDFWTTTTKRKYSCSDWINRLPDYKTIYLRNSSHLYALKLLHRILRCQYSTSVHLTNQQGEKM